MNWFFKDQTIPQPALGVGRHKDAGRLTILVQDDIGGLEVKRRTDGEWNRVGPTPDAYNINVGDTIQVWSNDEYESVEHRVVVNSERERFSIPFFLNPSHYTWIEPLEELVNEKKPAKYKAYNWECFSIIGRTVISRSAMMKTFKFIISRLETNQFFVFPYYVFFKCTCHVI
ncbi:hypothetical protein RND71_000258 [Anisodus tanguticus]|uniref:Fe2OG dioxygenase domain-containing protein n=1 Tax=Anisodus tanguticus TaxID=243964 RepID=A0AAE1T0Z4_9SOLA|nr:hypothetical protein RND71_000258 [Anisodus tanguticus]